MERGELLELLRRLERVGPGSSCPICGGGHADGCALGRAIRELAGLPGEVLIREGSPL
jgi:hypothetical protein